MTTPHSPQDTIAGSGVDLSRVHMIGIGGAGMSGLARILLSRGSVVTGSDARDSRILLALSSMGARVAVGHSEDNLAPEGVDPTVVVTSFAAIPQDNPELVAARQRGIPVIRRSDLLAELMRGYRQFLIAGTHGKTSTTSMAVVALQAAGVDPSFAIGGQLNKSGTNAHQGSGDVFVAEADESDASLLSYEPTVAVVTNVEPDHLDFFKSPAAYFQVFDDFVDRVGPAERGGHLVVCLDDPHAAALGERAVARGVAVLGYGTSAACAAHTQVPCGAEVVDIAHTPSGSLARVKVDAAGQRTEVELGLRIPGDHMVLNAVAALLGGVVIGAPAAAVAEGVSGFTGVRRRFELKGAVTEGEHAGVQVYDDYAHHPTEVAAVVAAARARVQSQGSGRVIVVFQPHLYSRTIEFADEFAAALSAADSVVVLDIFGAREAPVEGVDGRVIAAKVTAPVVYEPDFSQVPQRVAELVQPGDIVLTMGAGSVTMLGDEIVAVL